MLAKTIKLSLFLASASALVGASPLLTARQDAGAANSTAGNSYLPTFPVGIASATWDGQLFYPKPIDDFEASKFVGPQPDGDSRPVWYQWAASEQPFLTGCRCIYARYGTNENGTVSVENSCTRGGQTTGIRGYAAATPDYGNGTFQVAFFGTTPDQPGPNYVVTRAYSNKSGEDKQRFDNADTTDEDKQARQQDNDEEDEERQYEIVIVGSQNFTGWFLLSRTRNVETDVVEAYLREVANAGFNLTQPYEIYDQSNCGEEPHYSPEA